MRLPSIVAKKIDINFVFKIVATCFLIKLCMKFAPYLYQKSANCALNIVLFYADVAHKIRSL